jgi:hypothetical protein
MLDSTVLTFSDLDEFHAHIRGAQVDGIVTSRGNFSVKWTRLQLGLLSIQRSEETLPRVVKNAIDAKQYAVVFATRSLPASLSPARRRSGQKGLATTCSCSTSSAAALDFIGTASTGAR